MGANGCAPRVARVKTLNRPGRPVFFADRTRAYEIARQLPRRRAQGLERQQRGGGDIALLLQRAELLFGHDT
ncbi:MAG: hypothetical protein E6294_13825, partial [Klebsiella sp.]|nr:hypothetical protein [Klebsiella sp.]